MNGTLLAILGVVAFCFLASFGFAKVAEEDTRKGPYYIVPAEIAGCTATFMFLAGLMMVGFILVVYFAWGCNLWPWEPATCGN